mgnify:CR=1 FL=1
MDIIKSIEHEQMKNKIPDLRVGNTVTKVIPTTIAKITITANNSTKVNPFLFNFFIFLSSLL